MFYHQLPRPYGRGMLKCSLLEFKENSHLSDRSKGPVLSDHYKDYIAQNLEKTFPQSHFDRFELTLSLGKIKQLESVL